MLLLHLQRCAPGRYSIHHDDDDDDDDDDDGDVQAKKVCLLASHILLYRYRMKNKQAGISFSHIHHGS